MKELLPYLAALVSVLGLVLTYSVFQHNKDREKKLDLQGKLGLITEVDKRLALVEFQMTILAKGFSYSSSQALHSPHTPELDGLIEKFQREDINDLELQKFKMELQKIKNNDLESPLKRKAASEVLTLIRLRYEVIPESELSQSAGKRS